MSGRVQIGDVLDTLLADGPATEGIREQAGRMLEALAALGATEKPAAPGMAGIADRRGLVPAETLDLTRSPVQELPSLADRMRSEAAPEVPVLQVEGPLEEVRPAAPTVRPSAAQRFTMVGSLDLYRADGLEEVRTARVQPVSDNAANPHLLQKLRNGMVESARYFQPDDLIWVSDPIL